MLQISKQMQQHTNNFGAMESRVHSKNGASLKSQMSRGNAILNMGLKSIIICFLFLSTSVAYSQSKKDFEEMINHATIFRSESGKAYYTVNIPSYMKIDVYDFKRYFSKHKDLKLLEKKTFQTWIRVGGREESITCVRWFKFESKDGSYEQQKGIDINDDTDLIWFHEGTISYGAKYGLKNPHTGVIIVPAQFPYHSEFKEGMAVINLGGLDGVITSKGKIVVPAGTYKNISDFKDGVAVVTTKNNETIFINKQGQQIIGDDLKQIDDKAYAGAQSKNTVKDYEDYLKLYPQGWNVAEARKNIETLKYNGVAAIIEEYRTEMTRAMGAKEFSKLATFKSFISNKTGEKLELSLDDFIKDFTNNDSKGIIPTARYCLKLEKVIGGISTINYYADVLAIGEFKELYSRKFFSEEKTLVRDDAERSRQAVRETTEELNELITSKIEPLTDFIALKQHIADKSKIIEYKIRTKAEWDAAERAEKAATQRRWDAVRCAQCEMDVEKSKFPKYEKDFWGCTIQNPGYLVMKNGKKQEFYYGDGKWYTLSGFIFTSKEKFDTLDDLYAVFLKQCTKEYCK